MGILDGIKDKFSWLGSVIKERAGVSWQIMMDHKPGFGGLAFFPAVIIGFFLVYDEVSTFFSPSLKYVLAALQKSNSCYHTFYIFPYIANTPNIAALKIMCQLVNFNAVSFLLWCIQLSFILFIGALILLQFDFMQSRIN